MLRWPLPYLLVGTAFNEMLEPNPVFSSLIPLGLILGGSPQIVRGISISVTTSAPS